MCPSNVKAGSTFDVRGAPENARNADNRNDESSRRDYTVEGFEDISQTSSTDASRCTCSSRLDGRGRLLKTFQDHYRRYSYFNSCTAHKISDTSVPHAARVTHQCLRAQNWHLRRTRQHKHTDRAALTTHVHVHDPSPNTPRTTL